MPEATDYTVTYGRGPTPEAAIKALRANVHKGIAQGWEPIGGVAAQAAAGADGTPEVVILQAMVKPPAREPGG